MVHTTGIQAVGCWGRRLHLLWQRGILSDTRRKKNSKLAWKFSLVRRISLWGNPYFSNRDIFYQHMYLILIYKIWLNTTCVSVLGRGILRINRAGKNNRRIAILLWQWGGYIVSLHSTGWPGTCYVDWAGLKTTQIHQALCTDCWE